MTLCERTNEIEEHMKQELSQGLSAIFFVLNELIFHDVKLVQLTKVEIKCMSFDKSMRAMLAVLIAACCGVLNRQKCLFLFFWFFVTLTLRPVHGSSLSLNGGKLKIKTYGFLTSECAGQTKKCAGNQKSVKSLIPFIALFAQSF